MDSDPPMYASPIKEYGPGFNDPEADLENSGMSSDRWVLRVESNIIVWDAGMSNCPAAWHSDT